MREEAIGMRYESEGRATIASRRPALTRLAALGTLSHAEVVQLSLSHVMP